MALHEIIKSIVEEGSGIVIATLGREVQDCKLVYPDALRSMLADGYFGPQWNPVDTRCQELTALFEMAGHSPVDVAWRAYSRLQPGNGGGGAGEVEFMYIVKDHRLLLRSGG